MKSTVEQLNPVQYRVQVEVSPEEVNQAFENVFRRLQKKARVQGFRPGKAPLGVIKKFYGQSASSEVHENLINQHLFAALNEQTIRPIASPVVDSKEFPTLDKSFAFSAVVDILPTLELQGYKGVEVSAESYAVKDETIERELTMLRRRFARTRPIEPGQPAADGMLAVVSHKASLDGQDVPSMTVTGMGVQLGQKELFEGLEGEILGMTTGQTKTATVTLPETYGEADLAGKALQFEITLDDLKHLDIPALDDEFAKDLEYESAEALQRNVREHLEARAKELSRQRVEVAILDKVLEANPFEVPPAMVDQVIDSMIQEANFKTDEERQSALRNRELRERCLPTARRRTQNTLILWHVTQKEQLKVSDDEVNTRVEEALQSMSQLNPKQRVRLKGNLEPRVRENLIFEKAMDFLIDNAKITEVPSPL